MGKYPQEREIVDKYTYLNEENAGLNWGFRTCETRKIKIYGESQEATKGN